MIPSFAARLAALTGWRRLGLSFLAGAVSVLALPPVHAVPVLLLTFPMLLWLLDGAKPPEARRPWLSAFLIGWWFGFGWFVGGLYWIANALLIDAARFGWMIPFAVGGLSAYFAIYVGLTTLVVHVSRARGLARILVFAGGWTLAEWLRGWVLTGFPWNPLGTVWMPWTEMLQAASWVGVYGLSLATAFVAAAPAVLGWAGTARPVPLAAAAAIVALLWGVGAVRLPDGAAPNVEGKVLRLVQPAIPQSEKWNPEKRADHLRQHLIMSLEPADRPPTAVIWGETALPFPLAGAQEDLLSVVATAVDWPGQENLRTDRTLIAGVVRTTPRGQDPFQVWNSLAIVDGGGALRGTYDKSHLVPFGEYVPLREVLPLEKITPGSTDFSAGDGPRTIEVPNLPPASPLICYEIIFPGAVVDPANRPGWLLNVTNDGWYGYSSGPFQHLATARLRSVEEGLPLVRVANTGISAIVDPYGRVTENIPLSKAGIVDGELPAALEPTVFSRYGNAVPVVIAGIVLLLGVGLSRARRVQVARQE